MTNNNFNIQDYIPKNPKQKEEQMQLGIKTKRFSLNRSINQFADRLETNLAVMPFWRSYTFVFLLVSSIAFPAFIVILMIYNFDRLFIKIPLFYEPRNSSWILVDKGLVVLIPIAYGVLNLVLLNICNNIFQFDRRLANILALSMGVANVLFLIALSQILSITLI